MSFASDIETEVKRIFREQWTVTKATVVPDTASIALEKNVAKEIESGTHGTTLRFAIPPVPRDESG